MAGSRGGRRPGSGRKKAKVQEGRDAFREFLRKELGNDKWRKFILARAKKSDKILIELLRQAHGQPPQAIEVSGPNKGAIIYVAQTSTGDPALASPPVIPIGTDEGDGS